MPAKIENKKTLILDLDETLIHSNFDANLPYDFEVALNL